VLQSLYTNAKAMKRVILLVLMLSAFCLPSKGQMFIIYKDGEIVNNTGGGMGYHAGIADTMFEFRIVYGRYPNNKKELLDYDLDAVKHDSEVIDYSIYGLRAQDMEMVTKQIKNRRNKYTVSGDTGTFYVAKDKCTIQCIGGLAEMQIYNNLGFRAWTRSRFYDKDGKHRWFFDLDSPMMSKEVNSQFRYVVTMNRHEKDGLAGSKWFSPFFVPITVTRSGEISFNKDMSRLVGARLYYQEYGKPFSSENTIGAITLKEAIDPARLDAIKAYMKAYFDEHEEVERAELWEMLMFNNLPKGYASHKDNLTGLSVYKLNELDTHPLCNGVSFSQGFHREFVRGFHPEESDDNPYHFTIQFVIDKNGKLLGPRIKDKTPDMLSVYEKHVLETVNQIQDWEPGKVNGTPVNTFLTVPVIF